MQAGVEVEEVRAEPFELVPHVLADILNVGLEEDACSRGESLSQRPHERGLHDAALVVPLLEVGIGKLDSHRLHLGAAVLGVGLEPFTHRDCGVALSEVEVVNHPGVLAPLVAALDERCANVDAQKVRLGVLLSHHEVEPTAAAPDIDNQGSRGGCVHIVPCGHGRLALQARLQRVDVLPHADAADFLRRLRELQLGEHGVLHHQLRAVVALERDVVGGVGGGLDPLGILVIVHDDGIFVRGGVRTRDGSATAAAASFFGNV